MLKVIRTALVVILFLTPSGELLAVSMENAMNSAAEYFVKSAVKIPHGQKLHIRKIVNYNSNEQDRLGRRLENQLYFAFERQHPDFLLLLGEEKLTRNDVYISGTYEPRGDQIQVQLRVFRNETPPAILAQYQIAFDSETTRNRMLVAVLDVEAGSLKKGPIKAFSEIFRAALSQKDKFDIVNSADIDKLDPAAIQTASGCTRDECATIIGEQLGVDRVISTSLYQVNPNLFVLSGKIINIKNGAIIKSRTVKHNGDIATLDSAFEVLAQKLVSDTDEDTDVFPQTTGQVADEKHALLPKKQETPAADKGKAQTPSSAENRSDSILFLGITPIGINTDHSDISLCGRYLYRNRFVGGSRVRGGTL